VFRFKDFRVVALCHIIVSLGPRSSGVALKIYGLGSRFII
jgi:hypothetical protein